MDLPEPGLAGHHDHRVRPAGLDQSGEVGRGPEILVPLEDLGATDTVLPEDVARVADDVAPEVEVVVGGAEGNVLGRPMLPLEPGVDVPTLDTFGGLRVAAFEEFDQVTGERCVGGGAVVGGGEQLEAEVAPSGDRPTIHRLPGGDPGVAGIQEDHQDDMVLMILESRDAPVDEFRELERPEIGQIVGVGGHQVEVATHLVGELAVADVGEDQGGVCPGRLFNGGLDGGLGSGPPSGRGAGPAGIHPGALPCNNPGPVYSAVHGVGRRPRARSSNG